MTATGSISSPLTVEGRPGSRRPADGSPPGAADAEIVVPVYNEQNDLEPSVRRLHHYLTERFPLRWQVTIADNASQDQTWGIACRLATELDGVRAVHLAAKGRGLALRSTWLSSSASVVAYMDVDLSTDLDALLPLVAPLLSGHSDLAIGSRLARGARVVRGPKREVLSRGYNLLLRATLGSGCSDAQCGFKAMRADVARALVPLVEDNGWFFDTELLSLAEHNGLRIHEVPVDWVDDPDSRVQLRSTIAGDLQGVLRMLRRFAGGQGAIPVDGRIRRGLAPGVAGQVLRFAGIGMATTAMFAVLFLLMVGPLGPIPADIIALGICAAVNVMANRRVTFSGGGSASGRAGRRRQFLVGLALAAVPIALTVTTLVALGVAGQTSPGAELAALMVVFASVAVARFEVMRRWVCGP
jgi:putative flippase GtrA